MLSAWCGALPPVPGPSPAASQTSSFPEVAIPGGGGGSSPRSSTPRTERELQELELHTLPPPRFEARFKIVLVGPSGAGKSSALRALMKDTSGLDPQTTIGVDFQNYKHVVNGKLYRAQLWDTAGQERYKATSAAYYRNAVAFIGVLDMYRALHASSDLFRDCEADMSAEEIATAAAQHYFDVVFKEALDSPRNNTGFQCFNTGPRLFACFGNKIDLLVKERRVEDCMFRNSLKRLVEQRGGLYFDTCALHSAIDYRDSLVDAFKALFDTIVTIAEDYAERHPESREQTGLGMTPAPSPPGKRPAPKRSPLAAAARSSQSAATVTTTTAAVRHGIIADDDDDHGSCVVNSTTVKLLNYDEGVAEQDGSHEIYVRCKC